MDWDEFIKKKMFVFQRTNIFFYREIHLLSEKWEKASDGKYFE